MTGHYCFTPDSAAIYVCGLTGTISGTILPLIDRGFIPDSERIRGALGAPPEATGGIFWEQYDTKPVVDIADPAVVGPLRDRMQAALSRR